MKNWNVKLPDGRTFELESDNPEKELIEQGYPAFALERIAARTEFFVQVCRNRAKVRLWTINGYQMTGVITDTAEDHIILESSGKTSLVFKHAISTIRVED